jgi:tRNA pseudouridine55 synthase
LEGNVTKTAPYDHVTLDSVRAALAHFVGEIAQVPPIFSAIRKDGKRLYKSARQGQSAEDMEIAARTVQIYRCDLVPEVAHKQLPKFDIDVECGGGTYIRSLVRDIGYQLDTVATTTSLVRCQQGPFTLDRALAKENWSAESIQAALTEWNEWFVNSNEETD